MDYTILIQKIVMFCLYFNIIVNYILMIIALLVNLG